MVPKRRSDHALGTRTSVLTVTGWRTTNNSRDENYRTKSGNKVKLAVFLLGHPRV